jgi:hypothetical protein
MHAQPGDWLIVERADIDHEALVFPGPDAHVRTHEEHEVADARAQGRALAVQQRIRADRRWP